jgi:hypothetical protein
MFEACGRRDNEGMELALLLWLHFSEPMQLACVSDSDCTVVSEKRNEGVSNWLFEPVVRSELARGLRCRLGTPGHLTTECRHLQCTADFHENPRSY